MFNRKFILAFSFLIGVIASNALADSANNAKAMSYTCAACHGPQGISNNVLWPNLAGQKKGYLVKQLKDFHSGKRKNALMSSIAKSLTAEEIENLARYYSSL